ncbi:ribonuclease H-like domain-containing protein [Tanacetum coccineum]
MKSINKSTNEPNVLNESSNESEVNNLKNFNTQRLERPYDDEGDTSKVEGNRRVASNDYDMTDEDEDATIATQIGDNVTSEGNVHNTIGCNWIWKIKYKSSGEVDRYKARLVAKGYSQREAYDYEETFSPIVKMVTIKCLIALSV